MDAVHWKNPLIGWIDRRLPIFTMMQHDLVDYPTPKNLNYWWNFGSLAGIVLTIMIVTGIVLAMHYTPQVSMAFDSVQLIRRDVNGGSIIQGVHMVRQGQTTDWLHTEIPLAIKIGGEHHKIVQSHAVFPSDGLHDRLSLSHS